MALLSRVIEGSRAHVHTCVPAPCRPVEAAIAKGAAWSAPVLATAAAAPTYASSPYVCTPNAVMDWGAARDQLPSGTVYTIAGT